MRPAPLLLFAILGVGCAKPAEPATVESAGSPSVVQSNLTSEEMAKQIGIPMYPGSKAPDAMSNAPEKRSEGSIHYSMILTTTDSVDKVAGWYAKTTGLTSKPGMGGASIIGALKDGANVIITIAPEAGQTSIRIKAITYPKT